MAVNLIRFFFNLVISGFDGLGVACWLLVPKFTGRIFKGEEIFSMPSFGGKGKLSVPCRRFAACKRSLMA